MPAGRAHRRGARRIHQQAGLGSRTAGARQCRCGIRASKGTSACLRSLPIRWWSARSRRWSSCATACFPASILLPGSARSGAPLTIAAFATVFGRWGSVFIAVSVLLFAFSTLLSWSLYGQRCFEYLFGLRGTGLYRLLFLVVIVLGATMDLRLAWELSDTLNGLMALPNLVALWALSPHRAAPDAPVRRAAPQGTSAAKSAYAIGKSLRFPEKFPLPLCLAGGW